MAEESISQLSCKAEELIHVIEDVTARYRVAQYEGNSHYMTELATAHDKLRLMRANVDSLVSKLPKPESTGQTVLRVNSTYQTTSYESQSTGQIQKRNQTGRANKDSGVFSVDSGDFECSEEMMAKESINQLYVKLGQLKDVLDNVKSKCIVAEKDMNSQYTSDVLAVIDKLDTIRNSVDTLISYVTQARDIKGRVNRDSGLPSVTSSVFSSRGNSVFEDNDLNLNSLTIVEENVPAGPEQQCPSCTPLHTNETVEQESAMKGPSENEEIQSLKSEDNNEDIQSLKSQEDNNEDFSTRL